ncbi:hypothetical protein ABZ805_00225 [Saccharopolyspora sp. NPDC047091]|uniref:hypothetical protein n=1 Tax=Saccharopolyspora sp. NPDC047091 TaxID=3155924 RepID=UPI003400163A
MTGSCAQRGHWSRLRAWTARAAATAGLLGGAWLLAAGPAEAAPQHELVPAVQVEVAEPDIAPLSIERPAAPSTPEPVRVDQASTAAEQLGVADLATDITAGVREELEPVTESAGPLRAEPEPAEPDEVHQLAADQATGTTPDTAQPSDGTALRGADPGPAAPAPPAPTTAPDRTASEHAMPPAAADPEPQPTPAPAPVDHGGTAPHQVPPIAPPVAVTAAAAPGGSGPGARWMHAVLPTRPQLPGPVRAVGGHIETVTSRGIALIEPSTSPD